MWAKVQISLSNRTELHIRVDPGETFYYDKQAVMSIKKKKTLKMIF